MNAQDPLRNKDKPSWKTLHQTKEDKQTRMKEIITIGKSGDIETRVTIFASSLISKSPDGIVKLLKAYNLGSTEFQSHGPF